MLRRGQVCLVVRPLRKYLMRSFCILFLCLLASCGNIKTINKLSNLKKSVSWWKEIDRHNRDSLTTDTCLCRKRIFALFKVSKSDSNKYEYSYIYASDSTNGQLLFTYPHYSSSDSRIQFNDSCKIKEMLFGE
jgi:hypothetical protein